MTAATAAATATAAVVTMIVAAAAAAAAMIVTAATAAAFDLVFGNDCAVEDAVDDVIGIAGSAAEHLDAEVSQSNLSTGTDAAANHCVYVVGVEECCNSVMTAFFSRNDFSVNNLAFFNVKELELRCVTEMLTDFSVFVRRCNTHDVFSFWCNQFDPVVNSFVEFDVSAVNDERLAVDETVGNFLSCAFHDFTHGRARNIHRLGGLLVT